MKIDLEKLKEIEEQYKEQGLPNYTLHLMLSKVIAYDEAPYSLAPNNIVLAINTLKELGIIEAEDKKETKKPLEHLNS
jgi:hypothetical protein